MFVFGAQYLRGLTPDESAWRSDMRRMKELSFNTIRAWLVWNCLERSEGTVDTAFLHRFLDAAGENGLQVGFLFHLHGAPEWMTRKYEKYWYVNAQGQRFEPAVRPNTPSGGWPGLCFDNEEVRALERRFIQTVVTAVQGRKEVAFWEPMNEPHQWIDLQSNPPGHFCFCPATREKFRLWLERKYGTAQELSRAWGRPMASFSEARPPTWRFGYTDAVDFRTFTIDNIKEEVDFRASVIRGLDKARPVIAHAWGGGTVTCGQIGSMAFDDWKNAEGMDMWGYSAFPADYRHNVMLGLGTDATRSAGAGKTIWQSELSAGDVGMGLGRVGRVRPQVLGGWCWESIRHGAQGLLYWQYRKEAHGPEHGFPGLTDYDGGDTDNLLAAAKIGKTLQDNEQLFRGAVEEAQVALVFSMRACLVDWCDHRNSDLSIDALAGYYRCLWQENVPCDILHEDFITAQSLKRYKLVALPAPWALPKAARAALRAYVEGGGTLVSDPYFCGYDDDLHLAARMPGGGFHQVFGCEELDVFSARESTAVRLSSGETLAFAGGRIGQTFRDVQGEVLAAYEASGLPAVVAHRFGKGRAVACGVSIGLANAPRVTIGDDIHRHELAAAAEGPHAFFMGLVAGAGVRAPVRTGSRSVQASRLLGQEEDALIVINNQDAEQTVRVQLPRAYRGGEDLLEGGALSAGDTVALRLTPLQSRVLRLRK